MTQTKTRRRRRRREREREKEGEGEGEGEVGGRRRERIVRELYETENTYVSGLRCLVDTYKHALLQVCVCVCVCVCVYVCVRDFFFLL